MKPGREQFTKADYDFSDVKESELLACNLYEYARESRAARNEVTAIRKQIRVATGKAIRFSPRVQPLFHGPILMRLRSVAGYPATPWQHLSNQDKEQLFRLFAEFPRILRYALTWHTPPLSLLNEDNIRRPFFLAASNVNDPATMTLDMWKQWYRKCHPAIADNDSIKFGFFAVNLKYGRPVLIEEFTGLLRHFEGKSVVEFPPSIEKPKAKPPGRHSLRDPLNWLGAMRLRYYCDTFSEALKLMKVLRAENPDAIFYARRDSHNRACDAALSHFQKHFGWLDSDKPIHFTDGWRGGTQK